MQSIAASSYRPAPRVLSVATPTAAQAPTAPAPAAAAVSGPVVDLVPNQDHLARFSKIGLTSPGRLSFWTAGSFRRFLVSALTGISKEDLTRYGQRADLMRIPEMKPKVAYVLSNMGITGPADLAQYRGDDLAAKVQRGILYATVLAKSVELSANEGRIYEAPSHSQFEKLVADSVGLGNRLVP
jgi:predicted flap endonuclease-1-like 5' DNA nuclease